MLDVFFPCEGELVNSSFFTSSGTIIVRGSAVSGAEVMLDGAPVCIAGSDGNFEFPLKMTSEIFRVFTLTSGGETLVRRFVFDPDNSKRYNFFIDDNVFFLTDLVHNNSKSIFESFYLSFLRSLHEKYSFKVTLNTFFRNDHTPFDTSEIDERYKSEFEDNSDWLRLSCHAYSEFPDRPYSEAFPEKYPEHHRIVTENIVRYAGVKTLIEPVLTHFYTFSDPVARHYARSRGMRMYTRPDSFWNELAAKLNRLEPPLAVYDYEFDQLLIRLEFMCNLFPSDTLLEKLEKAYATRGRSFLNVGTHEQYSYKSYQAYLPDHFERIEKVVKSLTEHGYKPVFFTESMLDRGNGEK